MKIIPKSISTYMMLVLFSIISFLLLLFSFGYYFLESERQMNTLRNDLDIAGVQLASSLAAPVWNFDEHQINTFIDAFMKNRSVVMLELRTGGRTYLRGRDKNWKMTLNITPESSANQLVQQRPVLFLERNIGIIRVALTKKYIKEDLLRNVLLMFNIALLLDGAIFICIYLILSSKILKPIKMLDLFAGSVTGAAAGHLEKIPQSHFMGELETLRASLITMVDALDARYQEQKRSVEERLSLERHLLHAQKLESLGVLAGGIAHEFNNILMAIIGNAELAKMRINKESAAVENLDRIGQAATRAAALARQMLDYSGKGTFFVEKINLNSLLEEMLQMMKLSISRQASLRLNLTKPLPPVEADATQMRQIIMNLVINASEAISEKIGEIVITTGSMDCGPAYLKDVWLDENLTAGRYVYLEISDTGCGMDSETMQKIFDPFFSSKFIGRGLGMAAVLGIVRGHKGTIKVSSEPGKGSNFKILLPATGNPA